MKDVTVLIRDPAQQYEGLRTSLGLLLHATSVNMVLLDHEVAVMDEAYEENMGFLDEMEGERFSNNQVNVDKYGFKPITREEVVRLVMDSDIVIPF